MRVTAYNYNLPDWVRENIRTECEYCGALICDNSDTGVMTARWCANKYCPGHMQYKMAKVAKYFNVVGFGEKSALSYIRGHNCKNHLEILNKFFDYKPEVSLSTVAILADVEGFGESRASQTLDAFSSFGDYFAHTKGPVDPVLWQNKDFLIECESFFTIRQPLSQKQLWVMGTGSFHGYNNRQEYFNLLNQAFGQFVHIIEKGKRKSNIAYLIKERDAVDHSKSKIAAECGIPVVTPAEFVDILQSYYHIPTEV